MKMNCLTLLQFLISRFNYVFGRPMFLPSNFYANNLTFFFFFPFRIHVKTSLISRFPSFSFKLVLEKAEEPEIKLPTSLGSQKKQETYRKTPTSPLLIMPKPLTLQITTNCGKFFKRWEFQTTLPCPEKSVCRSRSNSQNWTWNIRLVPNRKRSTSRLYIITLLINICRVHHAKCWAG